MKQQLTKTFIKNTHSSITPSAIDYLQLSGALILILTLKNATINHVMSKAHFLLNDIDSHPIWSTEVF